GPGEPESGLGVVDGPGLVEAVEEGAVVLGLAPLLGAAAHPQEAVGGDERGRHQARIASGAGLEQAPLVDRQVEAVGRVGGHRAQAAHVISSRSATTSVAPASDRAWWPTLRSAPITAPKRPSAPAWTPETASS